MHRTRSTLVARTAVTASCLLAFAAVPPPALAARPAAATKGATAVPSAGVQGFLDLYNSLLQRLTTVDQEHQWAGATDVSERHDGGRTASGQMMAAFLGNPVVIRETKAWLGQKKGLTDLQTRQLHAMLLAASGAPGTIPQVVDARVAAESRQSSVQDSFVYCVDKGAGKSVGCARPLTANDIDRVLQKSTDLVERQRFWTASKEIGVPLKDGLATLQKLRNQVAREMGFSSFFALQVADYGMTVAEMRALTQGFVKDSRPLYDALHLWTRRELAKRYKQPVPTGVLPAHWLNNRWSQNWPGLAPGVDLDPLFKGKTPQWIVEQAERFYTSMGFAKLPGTFWQKSDLYPVPAGDKRQKNSHASAWHMDYAEDVRSLMSVEADSRWFGTAHHELGHIYYYQSYTRPEVPVVLRSGANRAFHEGIGELISIAAGQEPYLREQGILPADQKIDPIAFLLNEALDHSIAFLPWSAGVMTEFEYELYENDLPPAKWQATWWRLAAQYQNVEPPTADRLTDPLLCDACTKTHINDDPAQYYDYAIATVLKYQLHEYIATKILKQDPHSCNYYGHKEVGDWLRKILQKGQTEDWRKVLQEATGEPLSTRAMVAYFQPLKAWVDAENAKAAAK